MALCRDIEKLETPFKEKVKLLILELNRKGIKFFINETLRSLDIQDAYYSQGREPLEKVNMKRKKAGLWEISEKENKNCITWTMKSNHLVGRAIDIVPLNDKGKIDWNDAITFKKIADIAISLGLKAGFYWQNKDSPHIEA